MKTRENELHEPKIKFKVVRKNDIPYRAFAECSVCGCLLSKSGIYSTKERAEEKLPIPNYCPNCGARLKEVE